MVVISIFTALLLIVMFVIIIKLSIYIQTQFEYIQTNISIIENRTNEIKAINQSLKSNINNLSKIDRYIGIYNDNNAVISTNIDKIKDLYVDTNKSIIILNDKIKSIEAKCGSNNKTNRRTRVNKDKSADSQK